jgi:hypothetical protein
MGALSAVAPTHDPAAAEALVTEEEPAALREVLELAALAPAPAMNPAPRSGGALHRGVVAGRVQPARYEVRTDGALWPARQAESCLLVPEPGDVVLMSVAPGEPSYILAVLERTSDRPRVVQAPGGDPITVSAERLDLEGRAGVGVRAPVFDVVAGTAALAFRAVTLTSEVIRGATEKLEWVSRQLQTVADRSTHRAGTYVRSVASADTVVAEHMVRTAHQTMTSTTTHSVLDAGEDVHIHGKRIHMR